MATLSPSDLSRTPEGARVHLAGRILRRDAGRLVIADALSAIEAFFEAPLGDGLDEGDLAVISGTFEGGALRGASLLRIDYTPRSIGLDAAAGEGPLRPPRAETLRFIERGGGRRLFQRAEVVAAVRAWFRDRGYLEVETPALVPSPGLDLHLEALEVASAGYLVTSPEYQMKRLLVGGIPRIFQLARCFRGGEAGPRHEREFTMLEWYRAQATIEELMDETEALVRDILQRFAPEATPLAGGRVHFEGPFLRLSVAEAFERFAGIARLEMLRLSIVDEERWFRLLVDRVEPALASLGVPVFLHRYPMAQASLARADPEDPTVAERFELYFGALELCNGFGELTHPLEQRGRFLADQERRRAEGKPVYPLDQAFLAALSEGMPPAAGNALGLDRLVALALGAASLDEVMAFSAEALLPPNP